MSRFRLGAVVVLLAALAILWTLQRNRSKGAGRAGAEGAAAVGVAGASVTPGLGGVDLSASGDVPTMKSAERLRHILDEYRRMAVYPHWSRPHDAGTAYKLAYNKAIVSDLPMSDAPGSETTYRFSADRAHVAFGEAFTSWIEVWRTGDETRRIPAVIHEAWVMSVSGEAQGRTVKLVYRDDGADGDEIAGDLRYTNRFVPAQHEELRQGRLVHIVADVEAGGVRKPLMRDFTYTPRPVLEIVGVSDAVEDGSLVVTLDVEVHEPGLHTLEANLLAEDGRPLAYTDVSFPLEVGRTSVKLPFFGKIFHDLGVDGPYLARDFRGLVRKDHGEANLFWEDPRQHTTRPWRRSDLSPEEWQSPEKDEKIRGLEQLLEEAEAGGPPGGAAPPRHIVVDDEGNEHEVTPGAQPIAPPAPR